VTVAAPRRQYTLSDYLDVEAMSPDVKHELVGGEIFAMAGGTAAHAALSMAVGIVLGGHLRGKPCRIYSSDLRIFIPDGEVATYADAAIVCGPVAPAPGSPTHVTNPRVVFEVLSPSTANYDLGEKREHYQRLESLTDYVVIHQDRRRVEVWSRDGGGWSHRVHEGEARARLASIDVELDVGDLYATAGVDVA